MPNENFPIFLSHSCRPLGSPIRGKYAVRWRNVKGDERESFFITDSFQQVVDHVFSHRFRLFPFVVSVVLIGFYVYDEFYDWIDISDAPVDLDIILYCLS